LLGPRDTILAERDDLELDIEAEIAVITGDVPQSVKREKAGEHIRLFLLANDLTARALAGAELARGNGLFHSKLGAAFAPVAVTPDELGAAWDGRKVALPLEVGINDTQLGTPHAATDMQFDFPALLVAAARMHALGSGTIIASGAVSNRDAAAGVTSIAEKRALEAQDGEPQTPFLKDGDRVRIEMRDAAGNSLFGAIEQPVARPESGRKAEASAETADAVLSEALGDSD